VPSVTAVQPLHVAAWIEQQTRDHAAPTAKLRLAALRHLFDWLVTGQVIPVNPAGSVRGPSHVIKVGKTPVLVPEEARALLDKIEITTPVGLRDRALIGLMVFSSARIGAALGRRCVHAERAAVGAAARERRQSACHAVPPHAGELSAFLYRGVVLAEDPKGVLFRTIGRGTGVLTRTPLPQANAYAMIGRRAAAAWMATSSSCRRTFPARSGCRNSRATTSRSGPPMSDPRPDDRFTVAALPGAQSIHSLVVTPDTK